MNASFVVLLKRNRSAGLLRSARNDGMRRVPFQPRQHLLEVSEKLLPPVLGALVGPDGSSGTQSIDLGAQTLEKLFATDHVAACDRVAGPINIRSGPSQIVFA